MGSASRSLLRWVRRLGSLACALGLATQACQFPDYDLPDGNVAGGGAGAGGVNAGGMGGLPVAGMGPGESGTGGGGEGGAAGESNGGVSLCETVADCAPIVMDGDWSGPIALLEAVGGEALPDCPEGYGSPTDVHRELIVPNTGCTCTCAAVGQSCQTTLRIFEDFACGSECTTVIPTESCSSFTACWGSQGSMRALPPTVAGGACEATVTEADDVDWKFNARLCRPLSKLPGLCADSGEACAPTPEAPYLSGVCVTQTVADADAVPECPSEYPKAYGPYYRGHLDSRTCTACSCGPLVGGECAGSVVLGSAKDCKAGTPYGLGDMCTRFELAEPPSRVIADYQLTPGTCTVATASKVTGTATVAGSVTAVCCIR